MGISASKRVKATLSESSEFNSSCDSAFSHCLSLTQHAFPGVFPYQLADASDHLFHSLSASNFPLLRNWISHPPSQSQIDRALRRTNAHSQTLSPDQFKDWAVELFSDAVLSSAAKQLLRRLPIGVAIAGVGIVARSGKEVVGAAIGLYALGVATSLYCSLSG